MLLVSCAEMSALGTAVVLEFLHTLASRFALKEDELQCLIEHLQGVTSRYVCVMKYTASKLSLAHCNRENGTAWISQVWSRERLEWSLTTQPVHQMFSEPKPKHGLSRGE